MWVEAIERQGIALGYRPDRQDRKVLYEYFCEQPHITTCWLLSRAILAWEVSGAISESSKKERRKFYRCLRATKINDFIHHFSGIQAELHREGLADEHPYCIVRCYFTDSELIELGLQKFVTNNTGLLDHERGEWKWERSERFDSYYRRRNRPIPQVELGN